MTFHNFKPSTDTLEVGAEIRLAGREGELMNWLIARAGFKKLWGIKWSTGYNVDCGVNGAESHLFDLESFTFEIADKPAKPLTIDKRVKGNANSFANVIYEIAYKENNLSLLRKVKSFRVWLNSLEET